MKTVRFKLLSSQEFTMDLEETAKIGRIKKRIEDEIDLVTFPADKQRLIFNGKILEDTDTIDSLKTLDSTKFIVVLSMQKSCPPAESASTSSNQVEPKTQIKPTTNLTTEQQSTIDSLEGMGYPREEVQKALKAAFFDAARAVEYLCTGIPDNIPAEVLEPEKTSENGLDHLANSMAFQQIREQVNENPAMLLQVLQEIAAVNPELMHFIREHPHRFLQLLGGRIAQFDPEAIIKGIEDCFSKIAADTSNIQAAAPAVVAQQPQELSEADQTAVTNLQAFGFARQLCIEAYFACDKDEALAANYILQQMEEEGAAPQ